MSIQPYLFFDGRCEEAAEFYGKVLGAQVLMKMRFSDSPAPQPPGSVPPGSEHKIMHMAMKIGDSELLASDGHCGGQASFQGFSLSFTAPDDQAARRIFGDLAEGGQVQMPLTKTFFASTFGMVADRFGVSWMIITPH